MWSLIHYIHIKTSCWLAPPTIFHFLEFGHVLVAPSTLTCKILFLHISHIATLFSQWPNLLQALEHSNDDIINMI